MSEKLAWAAGLFDGEGCVSFSYSKAARSRHIELTVVQASTNGRAPNVLRRFVAAVGAGSVRGRSKKNPKWKPQYEIRLRTLSEIQVVLAKLWPWLGPVKRAQAKTAIAHFNAVKTRPYVRRGI